MTVDDEKFEERPHAGEHSTDFEPALASGDRKFESRQNWFRRVRMQNTGEFNGNWRNDKISTHRDNLNLVRSMSCQAELTEHQKTRALRLWQEAWENGVFEGCYKLESAYAAIVFAANEDADRWDPRYEPRADRHLRRVFDSVDGSSNRLIHAYEALTNYYGSD